MDTKFKHKILLCVDCSEEFVFTVSAQEYFAQKGFLEDPKRCKSCYLELKRTRKHNERDSFVREPHEVVFAEHLLGLPKDDFEESESSENQAG